MGGYLEGLMSVVPVFVAFRGVERPQTYRCAGTVMAAEAEVVNGHLPALLAMLAVLRRGGVLRVHDGSRLSLGVSREECCKAFSNAQLGRDCNCKAMTIAPELIRCRPDCLSFSASLVHFGFGNCALGSPSAMSAHGFVYFATGAAPVYGRNQPPGTGPLIGRNDWVGASGKGSEWVEFKRLFERLAWPRTRATQLSLRAV